MTTEDHERLYEQVKATKARVERAFVIGNMSDDEMEGDEGRYASEYECGDHPADIREAAQYVVDDALEIVGVWEGASRAEADYKGCRVVYSTGGPHIELDTVTSTWRGYWWGERCALLADADLVAYFDALVGES